MPMYDIFTESAPLGRFSHRVAISMCLSEGAVFFRPLIGPEVTLSVPGLSLVIPTSLPWKLVNL